jgi:hypothetical protein
MEGQYYALYSSLEVLKGKNKAGRMAQFDISPISSVYLHK